MVTCTADTHARLKRDSIAWSLLPLVGHMTLPADESGPEQVIELRNCQCHSTLAKEMRK